ncbi:MAG: hydroxymethylglutaryl-CoA reductase, degradative [Anaerolineales bacterium]
MPDAKTSRIAGFYNLSVSERLQQAARSAGLDEGWVEKYTLAGGIDLDQAEHMIENVVGIFGLPLGIATNFMVNGIERLVPMVIEEPSVVAGASFMAKLARSTGGFQAESDPSEMIGQIQVLEVKDLDLAAKRILAQQEELLAEANQADDMLLSLGGGAREIKVRILGDTSAGPMLVVHLVFDTLDAMGANAVNTAVEKLAPTIAALAGGRTQLRILTNLADRRLARARCRVTVEALAFDEFSGESVRDGIIEAWAFAEADPYRAATHNKGIMNGVDAIVIATGNDWRAVEAGAHAYAARSGRYRSLSTWSVGEQGELEGSLEMPLALGTVGGATRVHPLARANLALLGVGHARELAEITASVGLAQNLAALRALATEGIQRGHMELHARQVAIAAGAEGEQVEKVARAMVKRGRIHLEAAASILEAEEERSRKD